MIPTKEMTPHVPVSPDEIIEQVHEAYEIGITIAHLHARDQEGRPTYRKTVYSEIVEGVRKHCPDLVICLSLSGRNVSEFEKRSEPIEISPDMGSLTLSSLNFAREASVNSPEIIQKLSAKMLEYGVVPELEVFDLGMINYSKYLIRKGLLEPPFYYNIILGNIAGLQAGEEHVRVALADLPEGSYWALGGIGSNQSTAFRFAIALGGGVRIGLEDNIFLDADRKMLATNAQLVRRVHEMAVEFGRPVMSPREFGQLGFYNRKGKNAGTPGKSTSH
jgi:3-keto-5-aminohexanoate cleavage enzyme